MSGPLSTPPGSLLAAGDLGFGSVHQHAIREQLEARRAALVEAATRFAERFQTEPMSKKEEADWLSLNESVRHLDAQIAALEGTHEPD